MKTTIDLPDELVREVKLRALMQGRTLRDLIAEFIRLGLGSGPPNHPGTLPPGSPVTMSAAGLPVVKCRIDAPAARMSVEELIELEQAVQVGEDVQHARRPV